MKYCPICQGKLNKNNSQKISILPSILFSSYKKWFKKKLKKNIKTNRKVEVCKKCTTKYSKHMIDLDKIFKIWDNYSTQDKLFPLLFNHARKLSYINRFAGQFKIREENVAEHSYWVTMISLAIWIKYFSSQQKLIQNQDKILNDILITALFHDWAEIITSDIITPLKDMITTYYAQIENKIFINFEKKLQISNLTQLINDFNNKSTIAGTIVSIADIASAGIYIKEEIALGNKEFKKNLNKQAQKKLYDLLKKIKIKDPIILNIFNQIIIDIIKLL